MICLISAIPAPSKAGQLLCSLCVLSKICFILFSAKIAPSDFQAPMTSVARPAFLHDPFQTVDPFAPSSDLGSPSTTNHASPMGHDPFLFRQIDAQPSPPTKKPAPKLAPKVSVPSNAWGEPANGKSTGQWEPKWNGQSTSLDLIQYRALYDYTPVRPDEIPMTTGDIITVRLFDARERHSLLRVAHLRWIRRIRSRMKTGSSEELAMDKKDSFPPPMQNRSRMCISEELPSENSFPLDRHRQQQSHRKSILLPHYL